MNSRRIMGRWQEAGNQDEQGRVYRYLLRAKGSRGLREQLAGDCSRKELVRHPADVWTAQALARPNLAAG